MITLAGYKTGSPSIVLGLLGASAAPSPLWGLVTALIGFAGAIVAALIVRGKDRREQRARHRELRNEIQRQRLVVVRDPDRHGFLITDDELDELEQP